MLNIGFLVKSHVFIYGAIVTRIIRKVPVRQVSANRARHKSALKLNSQPTETMSSKSGFKFTNYDCIGFDLDNTLTRYKISQLLKLEYNTLARFLIEKKGFPSEHLSKPIEDNLDFIMKGLVLDAEKGNILHIDSRGHIVSGTHGTKELTKEQLVQYYGKDLHWDLAKSFASDPLTTWNGESSLRMRSLLDYFDMPAGLVFARAVDSLDEKNNNQPLPSYDIYPHIIAGLNEMFCREQFALNQGGFFPHIKQNPETYYHKCSEKLINWLKELRKRNKILFLITGSNIDFASHTATNSLGPKWKELFDIVIFFAKKPGFFTSNRPFIGVNGLEETTEIRNEDLKPAHCYTHGNSKGLIEFLKKHTGNENPKMLYIGDNLVQDVYAPASFIGWDTVAISEELQAEGFQAECDQNADKHFLTSAKWGSYFQHENKEPTFWRELISKHSRICIPSLEYVANYSVDHEFSCALHK